MNILYEKSEDYEQVDKPYSGDPENGELLVSSYGCMGCHQIQPEQDPEYVPSMQNIRLEQGPNLIGLGSKTNENGYSIGLRILIVTTLVLKCLT
ncbi:hypothetical protein CM15mP37_06520 [bacterium]|nr:MAG: hypothetical protein CM15mP37_06520 [bacterium]